MEAFEKLVRFLTIGIVLAILVLVGVNIVYELTERELSTTELMEEYILDKFGTGYYGELVYENEENVSFILHDTEWHTERKVIFNKDYYMHEYTRGS